MPKVALILDGTEAARQRFADVHETFERCLQTLRSDGYTDLILDVFTDEEVEALLQDIDSAHWAAIVFASNALRSEEVSAAVRRRSSDVHRYLRKGGGLLVLHHVTSSLSPLLPTTLCPAVISRASQSGLGRAQPVPPTDVLLRFPQEVDCELLRDLTQDELQQVRTVQHTSELPSLFFTAYQRSGLPATLKPVLEASDGALVVRTYEHVPERIVLCTLPLDWQGHRPNQMAATTALLANAIRYVSLGEPRRLVWRDPTGTANELIRRWLCTDGRTAMRIAPSAGEPTSDVDRWLLSNVDVLFVPAKGAGRFRQIKEVAALLANGGTVMSVAADDGPRTSEITAIVGRHEERVMTARLYAELRAVSGWDTLESAFAFRNIVAGLSLLWEDEVNRQSPLAISPYSLSEQLEPIIDRLSDPRHREDFGPSLALAQTLAFLNIPGSLDARVVEWMRADGAHREFDVALQTEAVLSQVSATPPRTFLHHVVAEFGPRPRTWSSLAPVARMLDAVALLAQAKLLLGDEQVATEVASIACDALDQFPALPERGWMSAETTADIVRGLIALHAALPSAAVSVRTRLAVHVASGAAALRRARARYERDANGVAWLARITHTLILAEREFPIGLQRLASMEWPDVEVVSATKADRSLLEHLAVENERLRVRVASLDEILEQSSQQLENERLAVSVGRVVATLVPTIILAGASWLLIRQIGWSSVPALLANVAVLLSISLTLLGGVFAALNRLHLLYSPARAFREWVEAQALPVLRSAKDVKTKG
jgi:hypothetical protein